MPADQSAALPRFVVFAVDVDDDSWKAKSPAEQQQVYEADYRFGALLAERGGQVVGGAELTHARESVVLTRRLEADPLVTEGPYAEAVEQISGFLIVEAPDLATVVETAAAMAAGHHRLIVRPMPADDEPGEA